MIDTTERQINIKDLVITEPARRPDMFFDPKRAISATDWNMVKKGVTKSSTGKPSLNIPMLAHLLTIFPDRRDEFADILPVAREKIDRAVVSDYMIRVLFPEEVEEIVQDRNIFMRPITLEYIKETVGKALPEMGVETLSFYSFYPDRVRELRELPGLRATLEANWPNDNKLNLDDAHQLYCAIALKVLFGPEAVQVTADQWTQLTQKLDLYRIQQNTQYFSAFAAVMTLLTADEIRVTDKGFKLVMPGDKSSFVDNPALPEVRKF